MPIQSFKTTGSGALSFTTTAACPFELSDIRLSLDAAASAGSFITQLDSVAGSEFDIILDKQTMRDVQFLHLISDDELRFDKGDELNFDWANAEGRMFGLEVRVVS